MNSTGWKASVPLVTPILDDLVGEFDKESFPARIIRGKTPIKVQPLRNESQSVEP